MAYAILMCAWYLIVFCFISVLLKVSYRLSKDKEFLVDFSKATKSKREQTPEEVNSLARAIAIITCILAVALERLLYFIFF